MTVPHSCPWCGGSCVHPAPVPASGVDGLPPVTPDADDPDPCPPHGIIRPDLSGDAA